MFYRIECGVSGTYHKYPEGTEPTPHTESIQKNFTEWSGCFKFCDSSLRAPKPNQFSAKDRFFFTEKGFKRFGKIILDRIKSGNNSTIQYEARVIKVKENQIDVKYRDKYQVSGLVKRK